MKSISIKLVDSSSSDFFLGRRLAKHIYGKVWGASSESMADDYDASVVVYMEGAIKGNLNIKRRHAGSGLPSEKYFGPAHWAEQCSLVRDENVAELCSFAVCDSLRSGDRIRVFRGLILGAHLYAMREGLELYVTVQRRELINTLVRMVGYPGFASIQQAMDMRNVPTDAYWATAPLPQLYYGYVNDPVSYRASMKVLSSCVGLGVRFGEGMPQEAGLVGEVRL